MKKMMGFIMGVAVAVVSATQLYVSDVDGMAKYKTLQAANDAASAGDTIIVGPLSSAQNFTLTKQLVVLGMGDYGLSEKHNQGSNIGTITVDPTTDTKGTKFVGCSFGELKSQGYIVSNYTFERCHFTCEVNGKFDSMTIVNSRLHNGGNGDVTFTNSVVQNSFVQMMGNSAGTIYNHCIISDAASTAYAENAQYTNCIIRANGASASETSSFINNVFTSGTTIGSASGTGNKFLANDAFSRLFVAGDWDGNIWDATKDLHIQTGSLAIKAGTDGTDLGIYGGAYPWVDGPWAERYATRGILPVVTGVYVINPLTVVGDTLKVNATGYKVQ